MLTPMYPALQDHGNSALRRGKLAVAPAMSSSEDVNAKPGTAKAPSTSVTKVAITGEGVTRVCNALAVNMSKQLLRIKAPSKPDDIQDNIVFSPLAVSSALTMVLAGTSGPTSRQLSAALNGADARTVHEQFRHVFNELGRIDGGIALSLANRLYADDRFRPLGGYQTTLDRCYKSTIESEHFHTDPEACRSSINACVERTTCFCIKELLPQGSLDSSTVLALVSALYFKGRWDTPFDPSRTVPGDFHESRTRVVRTRMMSGDAPARLNRYCDGLVGHALDVAYKGSGGRFSMTLMVPDQLDGLCTLVESLTPERLDNILRGFDPQQDVQLELPRFKLEDTTDLRVVLQAMGVKDLFDPNLAEFSGFSARGDALKQDSGTQTKGLALSVAMHKAFIEVNEEGVETEAPKDTRQTRGSFLTDPGGYTDTGAPYSPSHNARSRGLLRYRQETPHGPGLVEELHPSLPRNRWPVFYPGAWQYGERVASVSLCVTLPTQEEPALGEFAESRRKDGVIEGQGSSTCSRPLGGRLPAVQSGPHRFELAPPLANTSLTNLSGRGPKQHLL
ncbi:hypothetical protein HPB50_018389 [Hyalomma asiaticum]|uniref:Uncharacterized protein n=1 Tax=Hyalomma asiaticum TaxID=266040 RepID=A0ACB7RXB3_HYAAI|nr:hypothetical protein HPB50_018389 [Hyalomma asiaticum]